MIAANPSAAGRSPIAWPGTPVPPPLCQTALATTATRAGQHDRRREAGPAPATRRREDARGEGAEVGRQRPGRLGRPGVDRRRPSSRPGRRRSATTQHQPAAASRAAAPARSAAARRRRRPRCAATTAAGRAGCASPGTRWPRRAGTSAGRAGRCRGRGRSRGSAAASRSPRPSRRARCARSGAPRSGPATAARPLIHGCASRKPLSTKNSTTAIRSSPIKRSSRSVRPGFGPVRVRVHPHVQHDDGQRGEAAQTIQRVQTGARNPRLRPSVEGMSQS